MASVAHHRLHGAPAQAQDGDLGQVDDGREMAAADAALVGNSEGAAFEFVGETLRSRALPGKVLQLLREFEQALPVHVADDRNDQAGLRIHRDADVIVVLEDNLLGGFIEAAS